MLEEGSWFQSSYCTLEEGLGNGFMVSEGLLYVGGGFDFD